MSTSTNPILALYDFRSKQEYIYRTNKLQEITGASILLDGIYDQMINHLNKKLAARAQDGKPPFYNSPDDTIAYGDFVEKKEYLGQVLYQGGGSLMMLYRDKDIYKEANRIISRMVIEISHTLQLLAAHVEVEVSSSPNFIELRRALYAELAHTKRSLISFSPCNVTPFTHIDIASHQPIFTREYITEDDKTVRLQELTHEGLLKRKAFSAKYGQSEKETRNLDSAVTEKGEESLLAVIYIDGNGIGQKLMNALSKCDTSFDSGVKGLREFSANIHQNYVTEPFTQFDKWIKANENTKVFKEKFKSEWYYRKVIGGGDEITVICNARLALKLVQIYFETLKNASNCYACAGISIFHSHAPFATAYEIAEECCENAKKAVKEKEISANYLDFYFCRSGITNDLHSLRGKEDGHVSGLPYEVGDFINRIQSKIVPLFDAIGRSNVKALNSAILDGDDYYMFEIDRVNAYCGKTLISREEAMELKELIFDASCVYDIWFADKMDYSKKEGTFNEA